MSPWIKRTVVVILLLAIIGSFIAYKMWTKPHKDVEAATAISLNATALADAYEKNEEAANAMYLTKVLQVTGKVTDIKKNQDGKTVITLEGATMSSVQATVEKDTQALAKVGDTITLKGICNGYLTDVILVRCIVEK